MQRQNGIRELIARAEALGAHIVTTSDEEARRLEGRDLIASVQVFGLPGLGPHPMPVLSAVERLSAALHTLGG